jgi:CBS domain containing-hemolysin-like protein
VDQLARLGLRAPEGPYETLAGLVATRLGRIPVTGDVLQVAGWRLNVVDATGHRAARVLLHAPLDDAHPPAARHPEQRGEQQVGDGKGAGP